MIDIVTAFFDIGRGSWEGSKNNTEIPHFIKRTNTDYIDNFKRLCKIKNRIVVFTEEKFYDQLIEIGEQFGTNLKVIKYDLKNNFKDIKDKIRLVMDNSDFISHVSNPALPEYWNEDYVLINYLKSYFVTLSINHGLTSKTNPIAWIDFGYCRDDNRFPEENFTWKYDKFNDNKIHIFKIKDIVDTNLLQTIFNNDVYFQGCHVVSNAYGWDNFKKMMELNLQELLVNNLIDDDQTLILMSYLKYPSLFESHPINTSKDGWFVIFKEFYE